MPIKQWPPCQICGKPVTTSQGVITIYGEDIKQYEESHRDWEKKHPVGEQGYRILSSEDLFELPHYIKWHWGHMDCLREGVYEITYKRFDTVAKALSWTLHMMEKKWLGYTDWRTMVRAHFDLPDA